MPPAVLKEFLDIKIYSCCMYDDIIKQLIKQLKYNKKKKLASICAQIINDYIKEINLKQDYVIIPVPISKERLKERKYNHMAIVAEELSAISGFLAEKNLVIRTKDTIKQYKLHKQERIKNIKGAFEINNECNLSKETPLLLIDDITATGITFEEIIRTLKKSGYKNITAISVSTPDIWN